MVANIWDQYVNEAANRYGVPHALIQATLSQESGGRANAVSPKGAGGYMQIMPDTYAELAPKHGLGPDRFNPRDNILGGVAYMKQLYDKYGNWQDALSAYNAGPGRWDRVKAGTSTAPAETQAYTPSVLKRAGLPEQNVAMLPTPQAAQENGGMGDFSFGSARAQRPSLTGLLNVDEEKNFYEGLGGIWNMGQTPSQPPAPRGAVEDLPSQTGRLDVTGRMNELMQGLLAPQARGPQMTPGQYQLAGASEAVGQLAGITNRRVGIGEILGALGGGLTRGTAMAERAQQERLGSEFDRLGKIATIGNAQRTADLNERNSVYDNQYKQALTQAALAKGTDPKVVGEGVYENGVWKPAPWAKGNGAGGLFEGNAAEVQGINQMIRDGRITVQQGAEWLASKGIPTGNGGYVMASPMALPGAGSPAAAGAVPNPAASGAPPPAAPDQAAPGVTTIRRADAKDIPQTVQNNLLENANALRKAEDALSAVIRTPGATGPGMGLLNMLPGDSINWLHPEGAAARAGISDIGSLKIHDRSGAAVTAAEFPRLAPFVPQVGDNPDTVRLKLQRFREELANEIRDQAALYNAEQGYRANPILDEVVKTGRAPRYEAPISGNDPNNPANTGQGGLSGLSDDDLLKQLGLGK